MTTKILEQESAADRLIDLVKRRGAMQLRAILATTYTFDRSLWEKLLTALVDEDYLVSPALRRIPIDVICDRRHFRQKGRGYEVKQWPGDNLFHPKLLFLLFEDGLVWMEGSLNLTNAGWSSNRELASIHVADDKRLPGSLYCFLRHLNKQIPSAASVTRILENTKGKKRDDPVLCSLDTAIGETFLDQVDRAREVHVISPFFDARETAGLDAGNLECELDQGALKKLVSKWPAAEYQFYLPRAGDEPSCVLGKKETFQSALQEQIRKKRVWFHVVPPKPGPLHAKAIVIISGKKGGQATLLAGSPNLTSKALFSMGKKANVEIARVTETSTSQARTLLKELPAKGFTIDKIEFIARKQKTTPGWDVLDRVVYSAKTQTLTIQWRKKDKQPSTELVYAGKAMRMDKGGCSKSDFCLNDDDFSLIARNKNDHKQQSIYPIELDYAEASCLSASEDIPRTPEDWLAQLGDFGGERVTSTKGKGTGKGKKDAQKASTSFSIAERVRSIAAKMTYLATALADNNRSDDEKQALRTLALTIFDVHDPATVTDDKDAQWHVWVRLEILAVIATCRDREIKNNLTRMRRGVGIGSLKHRADRANYRKMLRALTGGAR